MTTCALCGKQLDTRSSSTYQAVTGWVGIHGGKGFKLDARLQAFAHKVCLDLKAQGHLRQEAMQVDSPA